MPPEVQTWFLAFTRAGAFLAVLPMFTGAGIPVQVRLALSAALGLLVAPLVGPVELGNLRLGGLIAVCAQEAVAGLTLGFVARMVFFAADLAGRLLANEMGLALGNLFDPLTQTSVQVPGAILFWMTLMLVLTLDLHHWLLAAFQQSYQVLPPGAARITQPVFAEILSHTGRIFVVGVKMAAPLIAVSFIILLIFSVLSRAVPQMNVFTESFAIRILAGLVVMGLTLGIMAEHISNYLRRLPGDLLTVSRALALGP